MANRTAYSRVRETSITTSGAIQLAGAVSGFRTFASAHADQDPVWVVERMGNDFQTLECTFNATPNTLTINTVIESYVGGVSTVYPSATANTWGAGSKEVYEDLPGPRAAFLDLVINNVPGARSALGISQAVALAASQNFNAVTAAGSYYTIDTASTNAPVSSEGWFLFVETGPSNYVCQTATRMDAAGAATYTRTLISGTWGAWQYVISGAGAGQAPTSGMVGEVISGSGSTGTLSSGVYANACSLTLPSGIWDIDGTWGWGGPGATQTFNWIAEFGTNSASSSGSVFIASERIGASSPSGDMTVLITMPRTRVAISTTTQYYANAQATISSGSGYTCTATVRATRVS